jgi:hypothetical protein
VHEKECQLSVYSITVFEKLFYLFPQRRLELFGLVFREQFCHRVDEFGAKILAKVVSVSPQERRRTSPYPFFGLACLMKLIFLCLLILICFFLTPFLLLLNLTLQVVNFLKTYFKEGKVIIHYWMFI